MANVLLVAYLLIVLAMIVVILIQRSEGGALGIGGGSGGGLMTVRGSANLLTRTTAILAVLFFASAIGLTLLNNFDRGTSGILERATSEGGEQPNSVLDALNALQGDEDSSTLPVPASDAATETEAPAESASDLPVPAATESAAPEAAAPAPDEAAPSSTGTGGGATEQTPAPAGN